jgi:hypothetical protein
LPDSPAIFSTGKAQEPHVAELREVTTTQSRWKKGGEDGDDELIEAPLKEKEITEWMVRDFCWFV